MKAGLKNSHLGGKRWKNTGGKEQELAKAARHTGKAAQVEERKARTKKKKNSEDRVKKTSV